MAKKATRSKPQETAARVVVANTRPRVIRLPVTFDMIDPDGKNRVGSVVSVLWPGVSLVDANLWARIEEGADQARKRADERGRKQPHGAAYFIDNGYVRLLGAPETFAELSDHDARTYLDATGKVRQLDEIEPYAGPHAPLVAQQRDIVARIARGDDARGVPTLLSELKTAVL